MPAAGVAPDDTEPRGPGAGQGDDISEYAYLGHGTTRTPAPGRQPPHAAERSARLKRERREVVQWAEGVADLVARTARGATVLPGEAAALGLEPDRLAGAAAALADAGRRWRTLPVGERWTLEWRQPVGSPRRGRSRRR